MNSGIFLLNQDGSLEEMNQTEYVSEAHLQELLQKYPNLLVGNQINEREPCKWLLVSREVPIPDSNYGSGRWSLDHLFLDQDGIPTLVEVKRSTDTRIRREVVGQLLEYAANALNFWSVDTIRKNFEINCQKEKINPDERIITAYSVNDIEDFWYKVKANLENGRIRLIFVADEIPFELKTLVEFLNENLIDIEVIAVEIKQFVGEGNKILAPRVIGQTSKSQIRKENITSRKQWNAEMFFTELEKRQSTKVKAVAEKIYEWAIRQNLDITWGQGGRSGSMNVYLFINNRRYFSFSCWTYDSVEILFQYMKLQPYLNDTESRKKILTKLNKISGIDIPLSKLELRPSLSYKDLIDKNNFEIFISIWEEYFNEIRKLESVQNN